MTGAILFGKLPAHGDFVARGLGAAERDALDAWLAGSLADARAGSGDDFAEMYDRAPPWRFAWDDGGTWTAGAMAPSIDGIGRRYPVMVAVRGLAADTVGGAAAAAESLIYDALAGGRTADALAGAMAAAPRSPGAEWTREAGWWTVDEQGSVAMRVDGAMPAGLIGTMLRMGA